MDEIWGREIFHHFVANVVYASGHLWSVRTALPVLLAAYSLQSAADLESGGSPRRPERVQKRYPDREVQQTEGTLLFIPYDRRNRQNITHGIRVHQIKNFITKNNTKIYGSWKQGTVALLDLKQRRDPEQPTSQSMLERAVEFCGSMRRWGRQETTRERPAVHLGLATPGTATYHQAGSPEKLGDFFLKSRASPIEQRQ